MRFFKGEKSIFFVRNKVIPEGSVVHIVQRAPGKEQLFLEKEDYLYFLKLLKEISSKFKVDVFCFVLMPNHFHLLVKFLESNASVAMKNLCERYAWFFNLKYKRKGHVFYGAYRASLCLDEKYLLTASLYIHINPAKAGLVLDPSLYQWSSSSLYTTDFGGESFIKYRFILNIINGDISQARSSYSNLLYRSAEEKISNFSKIDRSLAILRNNLFCDFSKISRLKEKHVSGYKQFLIEDSLKDYAKIRNLRTPESKKAKVYLIQQLLSRGYDIDDIARYMELTKRSVYRLLSF